MAIQQDLMTPSYKLSDVYWRFTSWHVTDAPQKDADRAVIATLVAYESRSRSKQQGSAPIPGSERQIQFVEINPANSGSGQPEWVLQDPTGQYALKQGEFSRARWSKGLGYALLRAKHPGFVDAEDVLEPGQKKVTI